MRRVLYERTPALACAMLLEVRMRTAAAWMMATAMALSVASGCATTAQATAARARATQHGVDVDDEYTMPTDAEESTRIPQLTAF
jgi:hypothetical protein